jgi:hypothetical protein
MRCTIEPDLEDRGRDFGSHAICHDVVCHIDAAIKRYNDRLDRRKEETLRKLQSPPRIVGVSERLHDARWDTLDVPPQHRYTDPAQALSQVAQGGTVVLVGGSYRWPAGVHDAKGVKIVAAQDANVIYTWASEPQLGYVPPPRNQQRHAAPSKIRPHGVR